jgi:predicted Fe-S protein YdhL (DUF1289 family)
VKRRSPRSDGESSARHEATVKAALATRTAVKPPPDSQSMTDAPVASPCINICQVDTERGWCTGCLRTRDEIANWAQSTNDEKRAVLARLAQRRAELAS